MSLVERIHQDVSWPIDVAQLITCSFLSIKLKVTTGSVNQVSHICLVQGMQDLFQHINGYTIVEVGFTIFDCSEACVRCNIHTGKSKGTDARLLAIIHIKLQIYRPPNFLISFLKPDRQVQILRKAKKNSELSGDQQLFF